MEYYLLSAVHLSIKEKVMTSKKCHEFNENFKSLIQVLKGKKQVMKTQI